VIKSSAESNEINADELAGEQIVQSLAKIDSLALGVALGTVFGLGIFLVTNLLIYKGGEIVGPNLGLLAQFFPGYRVTFGGSLIGLLYGFGSGFALGWLIAVIRNIIIKIYLHIINLRQKMVAVNDFIDSP
jgi:hypothetical protein